MSLKLDIEFLKNKGFFKQQETDEYGILDLKNKMLYVTTSDREWVKEVIKDITKTDVSYVWFFNPRSYVVYVYRNYGEVKWFTFNPNFKRTDYIKSKEDKINKFSPENVDVLFDVKYIVESFYKELWKIRIKMAESIKNLQDDKNKLLAAQKFIDRLIFTYFLAQLNVLTINIEEREWKLTKETVRKFFNWLNEKLSEFKLFSILTELFFDVFGEDENKRNFITFQVEDQKIKFEGPFLDGTIFREGELEGIKERKIEITSGIKDLFNLLNNYNWVVGEVLPEDEEVISVLTPEILGHIYEKFIISLENFPDLKRIKLDQLNVTQEEFRVGRQKIGAYYTPEEITTYICKNTIEPYLLDKLNGKYKNVEELLNSLSDRDKKQAIEILKNIKICDNACGSGAFLVKAAEILFRLRKSLGEETEDYEIKREIITTNLYGVDIMEGAIEIARLRLWLWLISSSNSKIEIQPLPNLEFNIMCGNSLIGYIELPQKWGAKLSDDPQKIRKLMEERDQLINKYKETHDSEKAKKMKSDIEKISKEIRLELNKRLFHELESKGIEIKWDEFIELKPFHWGFEFYEVFNPYKSKEEKGFDVVVGNPPYIENKKMKSEVEKNILKETYNSAYKLFDYAVVFIERSYQILKKGGLFSYIVTNKFTSTDYGIKIRELILKHTELRELLDISHIEVFEGIAIYPIIIIFKKDVCKAKTLLGIKIRDESSLSDSSFNKIFIPQSKFLEIPDYILDTSGNIPICEKIRKSKNVTALGNICDLFYRVLGFTGWNKILNLVINKKSENECLKFIGTANITPFVINEEIQLKVAGKVFKNCYLAFSKKFPKEGWDIFKREKLLIKEVALFLTTAYDKGEYANLTGMYMLIINNKNISYFYLLGLLNSKILDFYFRSLYGATHMAGGYLRFNGSYLKKLPIYIPQNAVEIHLIEELSNYIYLTKLFSLKERVNNEKLLEALIELLNCSIYALYFKDLIKTNFLVLMERHLKQLTIFKTNEEKLKVIKEIVEKISKDKKITDEINKIKNHKWVKIIEESYTNLKEHQSK